MIRLITYHDDRMSESGAKLKASAYVNGVQEVCTLGPIDLPEMFKQLAADCLKESKGAGLYVWKPYAVWYAMNKCMDGDYLIYADAGQEFVSGVQSVINHMDQDVMMFSNGWKHLDWCKMDVADGILGADTALVRAYDYKQTQASLIFFRVSKESREFVKEWMLWCLMPGFCDNSPSKLPNVPTFQETRWDQSVLCCLQIKHGYRLHWFPTLTAMHLRGDFPGDNYPGIVDHHRKRDHGKGEGDSEW